MDSVVLAQAVVLHIDGKSIFFYLFIDLLMNFYPGASSIQSTGIILGPCACLAHNCNNSY